MSQALAPIGLSTICESLLLILDAMDSCGGPDDEFEKVFTE